MERKELKYVVVQNRAMNCPNCQQKPARKIEPYGYMPCKQCSDKYKKERVSAAIELTTSDIKESRKEYSKDIIQRYRGDTPSLEYIKQYGSKGFTKADIKRAKNVWTENNFYVDKGEKI